MQERIYTLKEEEKRVEEKTINISDLIANFQKQTNEDQAKTLSFLEDLHNHERGAAKKERFEKLPKVVQVLLNLNQSEWDQLPQNGQELVLKKMSFLIKESEKIPDVEDFKKLSEEKKEAVLRSV